MIRLSRAAAVALALLATAACNRQPATQTKATQPDEVVTSRSNGQAIPNPRRGSFTKTPPGTYGYTTPPDNGAPSTAAKQQ